jgi:putative glycosyltransferase
MHANTPEGSEIALSIVTTLYNSVEFLQEFYQRVSAQAALISENYEIVLVNDGSSDESLSAALALMERDARVRVIDLSRNFGQHKAIMTGLAQAAGELIFLIDCDLEEDPELLTRFHIEMQQSHADVVYGVQAKRQGSFLKRASGHLFYKLFECLSSYPVPSNPLNARLMTRRYVNSLLLYQEREVYMAGLWAMTGFKQVPIATIKHSRGASSYTFAKRLSMTINALTSFSDTPLYFIFYLGGLIMALAAVAGFVLILRRLVISENLLGWSSLIVSVWMLGGLTIFCLGIMSIYLSKIFIETKQRPYTVVREVYSRRAGSVPLPGPWPKVAPFPSEQAS